MMPGRRNNGSQGGGYDKSLDGGFDGAPPGQYGSNIGMWAQAQPDHPSNMAGHNPAKLQTDRDLQFHRLQEMFKGQIDAEVVHMILTESNWNVEESLEKLLEISNTMPINTKPDRGPSLKSVADTFAASSSMASMGQDHPAMRPVDLGGHLRSRLPSVQHNEPNSSNLPMLSPRTPNLANLDFPSFPQQSLGDDGIQNALDALDSYANRDLSGDHCAFDPGSSYGSNTLFDNMVCSKPPSTEGYGLSTLSQQNMGFPPNNTERSSSDHFGPLPAGLDSGFMQGTDINRDSVPYHDFYSQSFQPVQTQSLVSSISATDMGGSGTGRCEPLSPRSAFNNAMLTETIPLDTRNRRPMREDSKDSATSENSRISDLSQYSEESVVDLSPAILKRPKHPKQFLRRQNISLDPQERESLEQLIEEVLIGGVDHGVIDSDESYTSGEEEYGEDGQHMKRKNEDGTKVPPPQLKVAAKHMKNIPPRFLKRLQTTQTGKTDEREDGEQELEDTVVKDEPDFERKSKKRGKGLLHSLVDYVEDDVIVTDPESDESVENNESTSHGLLPSYSQPQHSGAMPHPTVTNAPSSPNPPTSKPQQPHIMLRPNVVNCSDLDPERVIRTPPRMPYSSGPASRDQTPEPQSRHRSHANAPNNTFSVDAPEFVPRSFHPINPASHQAHIASPVTHIREQHIVVPPAYSFSPRSGSPYTVQSVANPYPGRAGSPYLGMAASLSPVMSRRSMGSPIAMVQVPTGKHSPIPPTFFIPKAPTSAAAASAVAMHNHAAGLIPYPTYPAPPYAIPPGMRYPMHPSFRPPFMPPGGPQPRPPHMAYKFSHKDRLQQNNSRPNSAPTVPPGTSGSRMAANLSSHSLTPSKGKTTPKQSTGSSSSNDGKCDKDVKEIKNLSTQLSKGNEEEVEPLQKVKSYLDQGKKLMVIMRGVPGSGKTHLAKELVHDGLILSTDDFFVCERGYEFDLAKISEAHEWNQNRAKKAVEAEKTPLIIDNTNTQAWEMKFYVELAIKNDYEMEIIEPDTPWKFRAKELAKRNKHGVTKENIQRMIDRYDHSVTLESIIASSDKIKAEVERKQRLVAAQQQQQQQPDTITSNSGAAPVEEKKTKKKTRRGKGRKKKARLRELREAEATKGLESKGKAEDADGTSEEESTPEREPSSDKSPAANDPKPSDIDQTETLDNSSLSSAINEYPADESESNESAEQKQEANPDVSVAEKEKEKGATTPQENEEKDTQPPDSLTVSEKTENESRNSGYISDDSDSYSEQSTTEYNLSQGSEEDVSLQPAVHAPPSKIHGGRKLHGSYLMEWVKTRLVRSLEEQLAHTIGPAQAQLEKLLEKYHNSPDVCAEIEEIIMEKMSDGMANKEVAEITSKAENLCLRDEVEVMESQQSKNLTVTDVNSIMHLLGQIKHPESCSDSDNMNDGNNNSQCLEQCEEDGEPKARLNAVPKNNSEMEKTYWETKPSESDPYTVGQVDTADPPHVPSSSDNSGDQVSESKSSTGAKPRRDRKRPYDRKRGKSHSDDFWTAAAEGYDQVDGAADTSKDSLLSPDHSGSQTPSASPDIGEDGSRRARRLSGKKRMAAQFSLPELEPGLKEQLMVRDWQLPDFSQQNIPFSAPVHQPPRATFDVETFTHPKDFASVYRLVHPKQGATSVQNPSEVEGFLRICSANGRDINDRISREETENKGAIPRKLMVDRSCSTGDAEKAPSDIQFLQSCFSTVSEEDLSDILHQCGGDMEWAANILLDAGYEYNEKRSVKKGAPVSSCDTSNSVAAANSGSGQSSKPGKSSSPSSGPLSLAQMCHQAIAPSKASTEEVQEQMVENSVCRLNSIDEFRRQHSVPDEFNSKLPERQTSLLDVADDETDVFYSPIEGPMSPAFPPPTVSDKSPIAGISEIPLVDGETRCPTGPAPGPSALASDMVLTLSPALADQLIALFGPVGFHISSDSLSPSDLVVKLNRKAAKQLHRRWALTLREKFSSEEVVIQNMIKQDEALAKKLQAEEEEERRRREDLAAAINVGQMRPGPPGAPAESLKEIMEEEMVIELSKKEYDGQLHSEAARSKQYANSLATKMKRQKLEQIFPKLDPLVLEEVYQASGYNMSKTVSSINDSLGMNEPVQNVWTPEAIQAYEDALMRKAVEASMQEEWLGTEEGADEGDGFQAVEDPQYQDIRAEASTHYRLRHECFQKAQEAFKRGLKSVASFYSQQGHIHTQKLKEANRRAAEKIIELRNTDVELTNTIDLHGLHVDEALRVLNDIIVKRERELRQRPDKRRNHLFVVTGRGSHSRGGKAKIRPAVLELLTRRNYNFTEDPPGMLKVMMRFRDDL